MILGDKFSNTRFALLLGGTLMLTGAAHADQSDVLEPFGGSAHSGVIVDTQIADSQQQTLQSLNVSIATR